ncbi:hypothetical protein AB0L06_39070 [Spirillospora sp. NPDC052269]
MSQLASLVRAFAQLLTPADGNGDRLDDWISTAEKENCDTSTCSSAA